MFAGSSQRAGAQREGVLARLQLYPERACVRKDGVLGAVLKGAHLLDRRLQLQLQSLGDASVWCQLAEIWVQEG